jgi:hypothetical protein
MTRYDYVEDLFSKFFQELLQEGKLDLLSTKDASAAANFFHIIESDKQLTKPQADYLVRILENNRPSLYHFGLDDELVSNPVFKKEFRILDLHKKIYVETTNKEIWICVKHPYQMKTSFEEYCLDASNSRFNHVVWLAEERIRKYHLNTINPILAKEFCEENSYDIEESFFELTDFIEEIWDSQDQILKRCIIDNDQVKLLNSSETASDYFKKNQTGTLKTDLFLAKSIGHTLSNPQPESFVETVCSYEENMFWIDNKDILIAALRDAEDKICVCVSKEKTGKWLQDFVEMMVESGFDKTDIKICFRESNMGKPEFNKWVKDNGHGGDLNEGKILIFRDKPPKWLIEKENYAKLIVLNGPFAPSSMIVQSWLEQQSCVVFYSNIEPSMSRNSVIVKL